MLEMWKILFIYLCIDLHHVRLPSRLIVLICTLYNFTVHRLKAQILSAHPFHGTGQSPIRLYNHIVLFS